MKIKSSVRDYDVRFVSKFEEALGAAANEPNLVTLIDSKVLELYKSEVEKILPQPFFAIDALETNKSFDRIGETITKLLEMGIRKNSQLLVVGGGILQDIGGFIASILYRGVDWTLIPTTLLAQCDSCIGSKTSVNIAKFKNQLGTFYPPKSVLISSDVLKTLSKDDLDSGACEALKLAAIDSATSIETMKDAIKSGLAEATLKSLVHQSLQIKKRFIEEDEHDRGPRNLLNYGHTFGHAIESVTNYEIPHGIAVGLGIEAATFFSMQLGFVSAEHYRAVLAGFAPMTNRFRGQVQSLSAQDLVGVMKTDKKNTSSDITFILTKGFGVMFKHQLAQVEAGRLLKDFLLSR